MSGGDGTPLPPPDDPQGRYGRPPPGGFGAPSNPYAPPAAPAAPVTIAYHAVSCPRATEALKYALVGFFCCGIVLGPLAIKKGLEAKRMIAATPGMTGDGKATVAIVIGVVEVVLFLLGMVLRVVRRGAKISLTVRVRRCIVRAWR